jgi:hypothetical protein
VSDFTLNAVIALKATVVEFISVGARVWSFEIEGAAEKRMIIK